MSMQHENSSSRKPDALRELYRDAVSADRGPSAQSTEAIWARARQRAAEASQSAAMPAAMKTGQQDSKLAANDRFWLRHALGGLAAIGLVGWLMLQHAAWWDGSDKGIGAEPAGQVVAETPEAVPADAPSSASTEVAEAAAADAVPAAEAASVAASATAPMANAPRAPARASTSRAEKSTQNRTAVQAEILQDAIKEEATVSASPRVNRPVSNAPTASKMQSSPAPSRAEVMDQAAEKTQEKSQDLSLLPLCPEEPVGAEAKATAKSAQSVRKREEAAVPTCRPRKPHAKRKVPAVTHSGAADSVANPDN